MLIFVLINLLEIVRSKSNNFEILTDVVLSDGMMFQIKGCLRCLSIEVQLQHYSESGTTYIPPLRLWSCEGFYLSTRSSLIR